MTRIALVTTTPDRLTTPDQDTAPLLAALRALGADADAPAWFDETVDWDGYDLLVLRSPWDYPRHQDAFLGWLDARDARRVANPPAIVRWNFDKSYLLQLAGRGVPIVPTEVCADLPSVREAVARTGSEWVVLKPTISAASLDTHLLRADDPSIPQRVDEILAQGKHVLVEPAIPELGSDGEHALFVIGGEYSHAAHKGPLLAPGGGVIGGVYTEHMSAAEPTDGERRVAQAAWDAIADMFPGEEPLYARFDVVTSAEHGALLIEAELFEPQYFFRLAPGAVDRVAAAILARADR